jgi:hypothetical protein
VKKKMLEEAQRLGLSVEEKPVNNWPRLREFFSKGVGRHDMAAMYDVAIGVFEKSPVWMEDTERILLNYMGWEYDPSTFVPGKNKLGNGCVRKVISRVKSDTRAVLRLSCKNGRSGFALLIKRPEEERRDANKKYIRRKPGFQLKSPPRPSSPAKRQSPRTKHSSPVENDVNITQKKRVQKVMISIVGVVILALCLATNPPPVCQAPQFCR